MDGVKKALSNDERVWTRTDSKLPPDGTVVDTMISDIGGERNQQQLKRQGRLWYFPDGSMYVYYTPTHWSEVLPALKETP